MGAVSPPNTPRQRPSSSYEVIIPFAEYAPSCSQSSTRAAGATTCATRAKVVSYSLTSRVPLLNERVVSEAARNMEPLSFDRVLADITPRAASSESDFVPPQRSLNSFV